MAASKPYCYWSAFGQFAIKVEAEHPRMLVCVSAAQLSLGDTLRKRKLISLHYWNSGTEVEKLTDQLQDLVFLHQSKNQAGLAMQYLRQLKTICNSDTVIKYFCDIGGAYVLAAFVDHSEKEVRSLCLDLSASITCKKRYFQNSFVLCHFLRMLMHLVQHSPCEMTKEKSLTLMFCLCIKNENVSQLFCQSGGAFLLVQMTICPLLSTASCVMLGMILEAVPQYKQRLYNDGAVAILAGRAISAHDDLLMIKAIEAMVIIMSECLETSSTDRTRDNAFRKLHYLSQQLEEQMEARSLATALMDVVHRAEAKEKEEE